MHLIHSRSDWVEGRGHFWRMIGGDLPKQVKIGVSLQHWLVGATLFVIATYNFGRCNNVWSVHQVFVIATCNMVGATFFGRLISFVATLIFILCEEVERSDAPYFRKVIMLTLHSNDSNFAEDD